MCSCQLNIDEFAFLKGVAGDESGRFYCLEHYMQNVSAPDSPKSHFQVSKNCFFNKPNNGGYIECFSPRHVVFTLT